MQNNNHNMRDFSTPNPNPNPCREAAGAAGTGPAFSFEALVAPCLADLKRQLELRQAMH